MLSLNEQGTEDLEVDFKGLKQAVRCKTALKVAIDEANDFDSLNNAWKLVGTRFEKVRLFAGYCQ